MRERLQGKGVIWKPNSLPRFPRPMNGLSRPLDWSKRMHVLIFVWRMPELLSHKRLSRRSDLQIKEKRKLDETENKLERSFMVGVRFSRLGWTSMLLALLQSLCTAVLTISGIRVAIGL